MARRVITVTEQGNMWTGRRELGPGRPVSFAATPSLLVISLAQDLGVDFDDLADGYANPPAEPDWSHIRDSSREARDRMLARAINAIGAAKIDSDVLARADFDGPTPVPEPA